MTQKVIVFTILIIGILIILLISIRYLCKVLNIIYTFITWYLQVSGRVRGAVGTPLTGYSGKIDAVGWYTPKSLFNCNGLTLFCS